MLEHLFAGGFVELDQVGDRHAARQAGCDDGSSAGSSDVVERGFVTYSNEAKSELLGVSPEIIAGHGAVSAETAAAMARGAVARAPVDLAISVTGIAGPGGATATKPVGLILFGLARRDGTCRTERHVFTGDRAAIRQAAVQRALELLDGELREASPGV